MKKIIIGILLLSLLGTALSGCGQVDEGTETAKSNTDVKVEDEISEAETTGMSHTQSVENITETIEAIASSYNILGDTITGEIVDPESFYRYVRTTLEDSEVIEDANALRLIKIFFSSGDNEYVLSYCGNDSFEWAEKIDYHDIDYTSFKIDSDTSEKLLDMMLAYSALGYVFEDTEYTILPEHTESDYIQQIAKSIPSAYEETRFYYLDERTTRYFVIENDGDALYYQQADSERTDVTIGDSTYYQESNFYEYFTDGSGKAYYRPESYDVFYYTDDFYGDIPAIPLAKEIAEQNRYLYSFSVNRDDHELIVEKWKSDDTTDYVLIKDNTVLAMWSYCEAAGMNLMHGFRTDEVQNGDIAEIVAHAEEHMDGMEVKRDDTHLSNSELRQIDIEKYGLFDLSSGIEIGQEVNPTGVVEEWRDYISSEENPFTIEFRWAGAGRNEHEICTFDSGNYYFRHDMELHDKSNNLGGEEWVINGRLFQSTYYTDEYDNREIFEWPLDEYTRVPIELLFENERRGDEYVGKCERAYEVTIGNEKYICEEWSLMLDRLWKVYIKDDNIVAWEGDFYNEPTINTIIRLEKSADSNLIKIPEGAKKYIAND